MGKRHRKQHEQRSTEGTRARLERLMDSGDSRGAVEAAKELVREQPGPESEALAVQAYTLRISALIAAGLAREAVAMANIVRERFPGQASVWAPVVENARLAAGDFDTVLGQLATAGAAERAIIEERLLPWLADPSVLVRSAALDPADALAREAAAIADLFEIVTSRLATAEELARLNEVRRRSPLAPWKLLVRAIDAFHRKEDERVASNVAAIDGRSPAARAGAVLTALLTGAVKGERSVAAERLIDRVSGGRAAVAAQLRNMETAADHDDRRRLREEIRTFLRSVDRLSPYAREQVRTALVLAFGTSFSAEQMAALFRLDGRDPSMHRYAALLMESSGLPLGAAVWSSYAEAFLAEGDIEPWQAAEIYLHALSLGMDVDDDDPFVCRDPTHGHPVDDDIPDVAGVIERIVALDPLPSVLARVVPYFDQLEEKELRRILTAWHKRDPKAPEPLVRLLALAEREEKYSDGVALIRQGDGLKILDPEYARLRQRVLFRSAERMLVAGKRDAAAALLADTAGSLEEAGELAGTWLLGLQWAAAPPEQASQLLAALAKRGVPAEIVMAEISGELGLPFALPASSPTPAELFEGVRRALEILQAVGRVPKRSQWILERTEPHLGLATEVQLTSVGHAALKLGMIPLAWKATKRGLAIGGVSLPRVLLLRAEILFDIRADSRHTLTVLEAARSLAEDAGDREAAARAAELAHSLRFVRTSGKKLAPDVIDAIVAAERASAAPIPVAQSKKKTRRKKAPKKEPQPAVKKGLFEP